MMPADVPEHFRGAVSIWATVASADGSKQVTFDDSTPVQKQLVDIKYSKETRKQFKPGLPYKGKVRGTEEEIGLTQPKWRGGTLALCQEHETLGWKVPVTSNAVAIILLLCL